MQRIITHAYGFIISVCQMFRYPSLFCFSARETGTHPQLSGQDERPVDTVVPQRQFRGLSQPDLLLFGVKP